jgi:hypothetical protein
VDAHPGSAVFHDELTVAAGELRAKDIRIGNIILSGAVSGIGGTDIKMPPALFIEKGTKKRAAVESGKAHPPDVRTGVYISQVGAVANDAHVIFVNRHNLWVVFENFIGTFASSALPYR